MNDGWKEKFVAVPFSGNGKKPRNAEHQKHRVRFTESHRSTVLDSTHMIHDIAVTLRFKCSSEEDYTKAKSN